MAVDVVQLLGIALVLLGVWLTVPLGVALTVTGLVVLGVGLVIEHG